MILIYLLWQQEFKNIQIDKTVPVEGVCLFPPENMHCWRLKMKDFDEDTEEIDADGLNESNTSPRTPEGNATFRVLSQLAKQQSIPRAAKSFSALDKTVDAAQTRANVIVTVEHDRAFCPRASCMCKWTFLCTTTTQMAKVKIYSFLRSL